jgi:hypothetical protein
VHDFAATGIGIDQEEGTAFGAHDATAVAGRRGRAAVAGRRGRAPVAGRRGRAAVAGRRAGAAAMDLYRVTNFYEINPSNLNPRDHNMATRMTGPLSYSGFLGDD